ncbi:MAG TPA: CPBP family intramembrane glutamic endopeptidase [bacterium]
MTAPRPARAADPEWAAVGSALLPGVGQMVNGDFAAGGAQMGLYFVLARQYLILLDKPDYLEPKDRVDSKNFFIDINKTTFEADLYGTALTDLTFYSAFAAYRDARQAISNTGYNTPAPRESLTDLAIAPYRWEYLQRPTTFIPLLVALYSAVSPATDDRYLYRPDRTITRNTLRNGAFVQSEMVGVGEEAFFRGFLNNGLSDSLGENWGLATSSLIFGLAHEGIGSQASIAQASLFGAYLGWLQQRNNYDIGEGVAIHFWWDFLVMLGMLKERTNKSQEVQLLNVSLRF